MVNENAFISVNEVLADVLVALDDQETRLLPIGFYKAQVRNGIDELGFDTYFVKDHTDVAIPSDHIIPFPAAAHKVDSIFIFTGEPDDIDYVRNLYWKKNARSAGFEKGYTANNRPGVYNDQYFTQNPTWGATEIAYFFMYVEGDIILSDACTGYDYCRIEYTGIPSGKYEEATMIPQGPKMMRDVLEFNNRLRA